ncbi:MAG: carbohydrate binding family 9 domain-containing protein [Gemmatimonadaceae bacterium]|nr:carbohydrate binding family 9 domain-containing protein [Gemmatimonadaceae bacterium]
MRPFVCVPLLIAAAPLGAQQLAPRNDPVRAPSAFTTSAIRADAAPVIDGRDRDAVWRSAQVIQGFRQFDPVEDAEPTFNTEARIAYDDRNLYILVRAFDPHPDSIMALLSRRDERTQSDYIRVTIDSYHDKRTGYQFMVNPAGVQRDIYLFNDSEEDLTWNAVWESKTAIDSLGWTAEFRIPLSQLRFSDRDDHTFGIGIFREVARLNERTSWPLFRRTQFGIASQLGEIHGIRGIGNNRRLEVMPYSVQSNESRQRGAAFGRTQRSSFGADMKVGLSSNLTLDATINPDFGQVEADPAVLNLGAFEQFFEERRPFFLEGTGIFSFAIDCNDGQCTGPFYSRRIGRPPQTGFLSRDGLAVPTSSTILGAAKLTGRLSSGLSIGVMNAVTAREDVADTLTVEPRTNYFVGRLQQDLRGGRSGIGLIMSAVNRDLDDQTLPWLRRAAYTGGLDLRHRFGPGGNLQFSGHLLGSTVQGSTDAIARTQRNGVHFYQRPDDDIQFDSTRTSLSGVSGGLNLQKSGGGITRFHTGVWYKSPGLEVNDVGYMQSVNNMGQSNWFALSFQEPRAFYRRLQINFNQWNSWLSDGTNTGHGGNVNMNGQLKNMWFFFGGVGGEMGALCAACLRGGPTYREMARMFSFFGFTGDQRRVAVPEMFVNFSRGDAGRSHSLNLNPSVAFRLASQFSARVGVSYSRNVDDRQFLGNYGVIGSDTAHYTVAHLDQKTVAVTTRVNWTASPTLSLQVYAQPFATGGEYSDWRRVRDPRNRSYDSQFEPFTQRGEPGGFNFKQFRSNSVLRWEYRPGSTLFFVWQQGRTQDGLDAGSFRLGRDYRNLFGAHPENTFLVKASYWFSL